MKNRRSFIFWGVALYLIMAVFNSHKVSAEEAVTVPGIVEVEENHLYMVPIGMDDGVKKGDTVEIVRDDQKIADARLISVLADNSMAEIVVLFVKTDVSESDSVRFIKKEEKKSVIRKTLGGDERAEVEEEITLKTKLADEKRRGLLGSEMHRYEETAAVEGPLQQEIQQLKAGLVSVRDQYEDKVDTILSAVGGDKDVLAVEKKWQEKLVSTEKRYQAQYNERKKLLEKEAARLEAKVATLSNELRVVNEGTDKRIQQLLSDLKDKGDELSTLKNTFVEEHLTGERQWKSKLENLEAQYQNQLRMQQEELERKSTSEKAQLQNEINYLKEQVDLVQKTSGSKNDELQIRLKEKEDLIDSQRKEQFSLESDLSRESERVRKLESDIVTLKDVIAAAQRVHEKELEIARKPLESKIEDMSVQFISTKHDYERDLNALRQSSQDDLMKNESQWVEKFAAVEQKYQSELARLNADSAAQVNQLRAESDGQKNVIELLKQSQAELASKLKASEQQYAQSQSDLNVLQNQLSVEKATRQENINLAKRPLEEKVAELSAQIAALGNNHANEINKLQAKINEDASLIEFLNTSMADLTTELDDREQQVVNLEDGLKLALGENEAMKKLHLERIRLAKQPLREEIKSLNGQMAALKNNYEIQMKNVQEDTSRQIFESEELWQAKMAEREKGYLGQVDALGKTIESLKAEHEQEIAALQAQWQAKVNEAELGYQKMLAEELGKKESVISFLQKEKTDLNAQLANMQKGHENKIKELEVIAEQGQAALNEQWQAKMSEREKGYLGQVDALGKTIESLKAEHEQEMAALQAQWGEKLNVDAQQWQAKLADMKEQYDMSLNDELKKQQQVADERYSKLEAMMASLKGNHEKELTLAEDASREKLSVSEQRFQMELAAQKESFQKQLDEQKRNAEERIVSISEQLNLVKGNADKTIDELRAQLEERRQLVSSLEKKASELTSSLEGKSAKVTVLEGNLSQLTEELKAAKTSYADQVRIAKQPLEEKIKTLNSELNSLWDEAKKELKVAEGQWEDKLAAKDDEWQAKLRENENSWKQRLSGVEGAKNDEIAGLRSELKSLEDSRANDIKLAKRPLETDIKSLNKEIQSIKDAAKQELAMAENEWKAKLNEKDREIKRIKKNPEEEWKAKFVELDREWKDKFAVAEESYQKGLKEQEVGLQAQITQLNRQLSLLKDDSSGVIDQLQKDLKDKSDSAGMLEKENSQIKADLNKKDGEIARLRNEMDAVKKDYENNMNTEGLQEVARLKDQIQEIKGSSEQQLDLLKNELQIERRVVADLEKEKSALQLQLSQDSSQGERIELAKNTLEAEVKKLNSELAFLKDDHEKKIEFLQRKAEDDLRSSEGQWQAKMAASEAQWNTKWAVREAEYQKQKADELNALEERTFSGKKEVQETIVSLNNRLKMLKDGSDSQVRDLEAELAAQQYQLTVKEAEYQERLMQVDKQWADKLALLEKEHQGELEKQKRANSQDFLDEKKELRETVIDLTRQFNELRDSSNNRIRELENDVEQKDYKLSLLENRSQQDLLGTEEKWQAKLTAFEEKRQRELMAQRQELEKQFVADKEKLQITVNDLTREINTLRDQYKLDLALKEEELAAEMALLERKYQDQLSGVKEGSMDQVKDLAEKTRTQQDLADSLEAKNAELAFDLEQRERELAGLRARVGELEKETKMSELTQSEKARLSKQSLEAKIEELSSQLKIVNEKAAQERQELEDRWKTKLAKTEENYIQRLKLQKEDLENKAATLDNKLGLIKDDHGKTIKEMQLELEDNQTLIRLLSKEKFELASGLEEKSRMIVALNEEIIDLKEDLETFKDMLPLSSSTGLKNADKIDRQALASENKAWYDSQKTSTEEYYALIREAILNKFKEFDFSDYEGKEGVIKIDFELFANGQPKEGPEFFGTRDQGLKALLTKCFQDALPFPPFPKDFGKESQRFSLGISFKKQ